MTVLTAPTITSVPVGDRIRGLEMPWHRVRRAAEGPAGAARALGPAEPHEFWAECVEVIPEAGEITTYVFRRWDGAPLVFRAGQYVNIAFPLGGADEGAVQRSYSLSSAPTRPWTFAVSIRRDPLGVVSSWAHEHLRPGMLLEMLGPVGSFHLPDEDRRARYLLLGAGSGITPLISMVRTLHDLPGRSDAVVLHHGAWPGGFAFARELEHLAAVDPRITVHHSLGARTAPGGWTGRAGRLTARMIDEVAPDANGRRVYVCGPQGYLDAAQSLLLEVGVDVTSIQVERFSDGARPGPAQHLEHAGHPEVPGTVERIDLQIPAPDQDPAVQAPVVRDPAVGVEGRGPADLPVMGEGPLTTAFVRTGVAVRLEPGQSILSAARSAGVRIGANCQEGMCGSCVSVLLSGRVDMDHRGGIRQREIETGRFLPCCSTARTDLVVDA